MSYEFNPASAQLEFPNPFAVENYFLFVSAACQCFGAVLVLLMCRQQIASHSFAFALIPILAGLALLLSGINQARRAMMQLRFFFGRSKPVSLAPEVLQGNDGTTPSAEFLKRIVRQNALDYPEPVGPLNGLLYSWLPNLIFAPVPIQRLAQRQFHNALSILATLLSFLIAWVGFSSLSSAAWMGVFYFGFSIFLLLRPIESASAKEAPVGIRAVVALVLCAVFGPVLIPFVARGWPDIGWLSLNGQTCFLLLAALAGVGLFFRALMAQMHAPPATNPALEQMTLSLNCHPNQLLHELDRTLQQDWTQKIPNRRYCRISPRVSGGTGSFRAEIMEETQPMPAGEVEPIDLRSAFALERYRPLAWLGTLGALLTVAALILLVAYAWNAQPTLGPPSMAAFLSLGMATLTLANFCLRVGHPLWGRFDFRSELIWVSMEGNYQAANVSTGNQYTDRIKTRKQIVNVETMTLRVWAAELHTVTFDKTWARNVIAIHGLSRRAGELARHLCQFAGEQSLIVTPTAQVDLQKIAFINATNTSADAVDQQLQRSKMQAVVAAQTRAKSAPVPASQPTNRCRTCAADAADSDRFCPTCGVRLLLSPEGGN